MTSEKMLEKVTELFREYLKIDSDGETNIERIISDISENPNDYKKSYRVVFSLYAEIVSELKSDIVAKSEKSKGSSSSRITAIKKFVKACEKSSNSMLRGLYQDEKGIWSICDGYRIYRLKENIKDLLHVKDARTIKSATMMESTKNNEVKIDLPDIATLKAFIATSGKDKPYIFETESFRIGLNPTYLIEAIQFLNTDVMYAKDAKSPVYMTNESKNEEAVICPINVK